MNISKASFVKIKRIAHAEMRRAMGVRTPGRQSGVCMDCGEHRGLCRDHRSYNDPMAVDLVCMPCNLRRGSASIEMTDVHTMEAIPLVYRWRTKGRAAA